MNSAVFETLQLNSEELALLAELLESERTDLLTEIHHTDNSTFRDQLHRRLTLVEGLAERCRHS